MTRTGLSRRKGLTSRTPLRSRTALVRHVGLAKVSAKRAGTPAKRYRPQPAVPADVRKTVADRSGGWCEIQLPGCLGEALHVHHRITTKFGGRHGAAKVEHDRLSDLLHACWLCHHVVTSPPASLPVYDLGLCLKESQIPTQVPVLLYRGRAVFLDDAGEVHEFEAVGT